MNKEAIDYTSEDFWATAPSDATHWEPGSEVWTPGWIKLIRNEKFCWGTGDQWREDFREDEFDYEELAKTFIPRPTTLRNHIQESSVNINEWFVDGKCAALPPVGSICEILGTVGQALSKQPFAWREVEIIAYTDFGGAPIGVAKDMDNATLGWGTASVFRPLPKEPTIQEKILDKWKAQTLEFAYDTKDSGHPVGSVIDFIVSNYDVKENT